MTVWVCDWTHWQGKPLDAAAVADEGYGMVKLKAGGAKLLTSDWHFVDPYFLRNADALLSEPRLIPAVYWYLSPMHPTAQAGLLYDLLVKTGTLEGWAAFLDLEEAGIKASHVVDFVQAWRRLTGDQPLHVYTSQRYWLSRFGGGPWLSGAGMMPVLEEARWVAESVRKNPQTPYASQQAKAIDPSWWEVSYGGWTEPTLIQFTDYALVDGKRVTASIYRGSKESLRSKLYD